MQLMISDDILRQAEVGEADLRLALAIQLYADNRLDYARACTLADMPVREFSRELLSRGLSVQQYPDAA